MPPDLEPDFSKIPPPRPDSFFVAGDAAAYFQAGLAAESERRWADALAAYDACLAVDPAHADASNNKGNTLRALRRPDAALAAFERACELRPGEALFHNNRAVMLSQLHRHDEALDAADRALALDPAMARAHHNRAVALMAPETPWLAGDHLHQKMLVCDWSDFGSASTALCARIARGALAASPFALLSISDDPALQRTAAELWSRQFPRDDSLGPLAQRSGGKIRLGYFSQDFRVHPVASLIAGVIEAHDRADFEVVGFSYGPDTGDAMHQRLEKAFDRFIDIRGMSDRDVAVRAREMRIDIAVDLGGYTGTARTGVFALRAAPVQVNAIGYPGTVGHTEIDYIIADPVLIPPTERAFYTERVVDLACFQANDRSRAIADTTPPRSALGLPEDAFVFCSFNKSYKFNPPVFEGWMRILKQVDGSVLWLFAANETASASLRAHAAANGVDPARLVFALPLPQAEHLARHRAADLFLDTWPYNAHATTSDALWVGLPVLTRTGRSFAARDAASLLTAVRLPELVTTTLADYEALAVALARDPARLAALKAKLAINREASVLFDAARYTHDLENAYRRMVKA